jgi:hypothetical protein
MKLANDDQIVLEFTNSELLIKKYINKLIKEENMQLASSGKYAIS